MVPVVFVSSPSDDLKKERMAVIRAIQALPWAVNAMEVFGATPAHPLETCFRAVDDCEVFVLIVGHRYGSRTPLGNSFTEAEYDRAWCNDKPCFVYLSNERATLPPQSPGETEEDAAALRRFRDRLESRHTVCRFDDLRDLRSRVVTDLLQRAPQELARRGAKIGKCDRALIAARAEPKGLGQDATEGGVPWEVIPLLADHADGRPLRVALNVLSADPTQRNDFRRRIQAISLPTSAPPFLYDQGPVSTPHSAMVIFGGGYRRPLRLSDNDACRIVRHVQDGAWLICAGQAWSWTYYKYGNHEVESYSLNRLGRYLGFTVTGKNVQQPTGGSLGDTEVSWETDGRKWVPSEITHDSGTPLAHDFRGRVIAVAGAFGRGKFAVLGHDKMLYPSEVLLQLIAMFEQMP